MRTSDRFLARRLVKPETITELRMDLQGDAVETSRAMDEAHRLFHDPDSGWNKCELDPCHTVGVLLGDLALLDLALHSGGRSA
jgi:hypothetical protein